MSKLPELVSSRMSEMRSKYIEANNRVVEQVDGMMEEFAETMCSVPDVSPGVQAYLVHAMERIREVVVDHIGLSIREFQTHYSPGEGDGMKSRRFPKFITEALERSFEVDQYPSDAEKSRLAKVCRLSTKQINNWFTNKRNRSKGHEGGRTY